jgi:sulfatase modifying factor 1
LDGLTAAPEIAIVGNDEEYPMKATLFALVSLLFIFTLIVPSIGFASVNPENNEPTDFVYLPLVASGNSPLIPSDPTPETGATNQSLLVDLSWTGDHPFGRPVTYDVYFEAGDSTPDVLVSDDQPGTTYDPGTLSANTHYYWQVIARDAYSTTSTGPIWDFWTVSGSHPPGEMVSVPAGEFQMGCAPGHNGGYGCDFSELPIHTVYLDAYNIDKYEVTNAQYAVFLNARGSHGCGRYECIDLDDPDVRISLQGGQYVVEAGYEDHPVIEVTWYGADLYCLAGRTRLPTEAEWEKAARGSADTCAFPWGDQSPNCRLANYADENEGYCVGDTSQVGAFPGGTSPYGALDMAGNAWEWVADWYDPDYYSTYPVDGWPPNPTGPSTGKFKVLRGGGWAVHDDPLRAAARHVGDPRGSSSGIGFRCVASLPEE